MSKKYNRPIKERLEDMVKISDDGCHLWHGFIHHSGYGNINIKNKIVQTHRLAYQIYVGEIPDGICVLHKCDVRNCVNPEHLFLGTRDDNNKDAAIKMRTSRGENRWCAKLTEVDVRNVRKDPRSSRKIATEYMVHHSVISKIKSGQIWKCVC